MRIFAPTEYTRKGARPTVLIKYKSGEAAQFLLDLAKMLLDLDRILLDPKTFLLDPTNVPPAAAN